MEQTILNALDDLTSYRSSQTRKSRALAALERVLAEVCLDGAPGNGDGKRLEEFRRLQDAFETNIATRLLPFLTQTLPQLENLSSPSLSTTPSLSTPPTPSRSSHRSHRSPEPDAASTTSSLARALQLLQGCCFLHEPSKAYLGRKVPLQLLLDILLASRPHHASSSSGSALGASSVSTISTASTLAPSSAAGVGSRTPSSNYPNPATAPSPVPLSPLEPPSSLPPPSPSASASAQAGLSSLALAALDTLLAILVDSPRALRAFESAGGLEGVVRTLKRAGVPREVRMRCLEFLYFYLLPETAPSTTPAPSGQHSPSTGSIHTASASPASTHSVSPTQPAEGLPARSQTPPSPFLAPSSAQPSRRASPLTPHSPRSPASGPSRPQTPVPDMHAVPPLTSSRSSSASSTTSLETTSSLPACPPLPRQPGSPIKLQQQHHQRGQSVPPTAAIARLKQEAEAQLEAFVPSTPKRVKVARIGIGMGTPRRPGSGSGSGSGLGTATPSTSLSREGSPFQVREGEVTTPSKDRSSAAGQRRVQRDSEGGAAGDVAGDGGAERKGMKGHGRTRSVPGFSLTTPSKSSSRDSSPGMRGLGLDLPMDDSGAPQDSSNLGESRLLSDSRLLGQSSVLGDGGRERTGEGEGEERVVRSTEEKKERLGMWLGNVDQLVEGVRRAGAWGVV